MAPLHAGLCFNVGPGGPRGARPTLASRPVAASYRVPKEIGGCCVQRDPCFSLRRIRYARARGERQQLGVSRAAPPPLGAPVEDLSVRPKKRPQGRERQLRRHGSRPPRRGKGGASRRHAGGLRPCTQSASPDVGLAVVRSGDFSSAWASTARGVVLRGAGPPRVRAPSSRAPVSTTAQGHSSRVHRRCRVFGDRGARRPRDVAQAERGG